MERDRELGRKELTQVRSFEFKMRLPGSYFERERSPHETDAEKGTKRRFIQEDICEFHGSCGAAFRVNIKCAGQVLAVDGG
jgi:hypothetical protein